MAKIPVGNFGQVVAAPGPQTEVPVGAFVSGANQAMAGIGKDLGGIGADLMQDLRRARSLRVMSESKLALADAHDVIARQVEDGQLDPNAAAAAWREQATKLSEERLQGLSGSEREVVGAQLSEVSGTLGRRLGEVAHKRTQANIAGELEALGVSLERENDPTKASHIYDAAVRKLGPTAGMSPAQVERSVNTFRERVYGTLAYSLVHDAKNSASDLRKVENRLASDEFAALDPQRRAQLMATITGYQTTLEQRAVAAQQRAELQAQAKERKAGQLTTEIFNMVTEGKRLDPEYAARVAQAVQGTSYAPMLEGLVKTAGDGAAFATQPLDTQKAILQALTARGNEKGWTPELSRQAETMHKVHEAALRDVRADPLNAAAERGVIDSVTPIDMAGGLPAILKSLESRATQASVVETWSGIPASPFTAAEAGQVAQLLNGLPVDQRAATLSGISNVIGSRSMGALATQLDQKDRTLALSAGLGDARMPNGGLISEQVLRGEQAIRDKRVQEAETNLWRSDIAKKVRGTMGSSRMEDAVIDASVLLRASGRAGAKNLSNDEAIKAVAGEIVERNGSRYPLPRGMDESSFRRALKQADPSMIETPIPDGNVYVGTTPMPVSQFLRGLPDAALRHAGQGVYTVSAGVGSVLNSQGLPVLVSVSRAPVLPKKD
ncbi:hypothetical protein D0839_16395 [Bordetella avium]|uniref:hypothetical protein n=1 Tax=Bordetella avium TaxID=521 RepID=UPI000E67BC99|nr:hypothetical protein [Bordetella avium]RIQ65872.1 hypothetical protein D0839_16395 [Bordetella avium]